jgi:SAM-dependent methyltransferase
MSNAPPRLTDRAALERARDRARRGGGPVSFLHELAATDVEERLAEVNRRFTAPAIVTGFPALWNDFLPNARIAPDADIVALHEGAHDLVIDALTLHWADDPVGRLVQARRALVPDGLFLGVLLGGRTLSALRAALATAEAELRGGLAPRVAPMAEIRDLGGLLQRAGFALPVADSAQYPVSYAHPLALMADLRAMGEGNALAARERRFLRRDVLRRAVDLYPQDADGRVVAGFEIVTLTGWAPAAGQPVPLRPGSATTRLADVLGTPERPLPPGGDD